MPRKTGGGSHGGGIGFTNTASPGGERRGNIWVSSQFDNIVEDANGYIFCNIKGNMIPIGNQAYDPVLYSPGIDTNPSSQEPASRIYIPNSAHYQGGAANPYLHYVPFHRVLDPVWPLACPEYTTFMTAQGIGSQGYDEESYYVDVDIILSPTRGFTGWHYDGEQVKGSDQPVNFQPYGSGENYYFTVTNKMGEIRELNQDQKGHNYGYFVYSQGESFPTDPSWNTSQTLERKRIGVPPCFMRIKGRLYFSDFPFVNRTLPTRLDFPSSNVTTWFLNQMATYTPPSDDDFIGAGAKRNNVNGNAFYTPFKMKDLPACPGEYVNEYTNSSASNDYPYYQYQYAKGILYEDNDDTLQQMLFMPISYPMVSTTFGANATTGVYSQSNGDYICRVTGVQDYQSQYNTDLFFKHSIPGFVPPIISLPGKIRSLTPDPNTAGFSNIDGQLSYFEFNPNMVSTQQNITTSYQYPKFCGLDNQSGNYLRMSTVGVPQYSFNQTHTAQNQRQPQNFTPIVFTDINRASRLWADTTIQLVDKYINGFLQPSVKYHEKYIQNVDCAVARCITSKIGNHSIRDPETHQYEAIGWSGRYKFIGFKGKISYFENGY